MELHAVAMVCHCLFDERHMVSNAVGPLRLECLCGAVNHLFEMFPIAAKWLERQNMRTRTVLQHGASLKARSSANVQHEARL